MQRNESSIDRSVDRPSREEIDRYLRAKDQDAVVRALTDAHEILVHTYWKRSDGTILHSDDSDAEVLGALIEKHIERFYGQPRDAQEMQP